ncbi:MAG: Zn-dependent exopeptidase M28 [Nanoarchaeota archaeon]|nr:Zn-dependent exopeptidase M28 [Nanoarchaeota archaeon]
MAKTYCIGLLAAAMYAHCPGTEQVQAGQPSPVAAEISQQEMYSMLEDLCDASDNHARGDIVIRELEAIGIDYQIQAFEREGNNYRNIIAKIDVENETANLAVSAHYDRVDVGCGVIDNGAGVAELISVLKEVKENPRTNDLTFLFFDGEEEGLLGSAYYVANIEEPFDALFNFDLGAFGDTIRVSLGIAPPKFDETIYSTESLNQFVFELCEEQGMPYIYINGSQDNVSFNRAGMPATGVGIIQGDPSITEFHVNDETDTMQYVDRDILTKMRDFMLLILDRY